VTPAAAPVTLAVAIAVAEEDGAPVQSDAWIDAQLAQANVLFEAAGVRFRWTARRPLPAPLTRAGSREDRDAFGGTMEPRAVNVSVIASLADVDEAGRFRMGVCWQNRKDHDKRYILLSSIARPSVLAHELGHFFGNPHSSVTDNVMSYDRTGGPVFFDTAQLARIHARAFAALAAGSLLEAPPAKWWP